MARHQEVRYLFHGRVLHLVVQTAEIVVCRSTIYFSQKVLKKKKIESVCKRESCEILIDNRKTKIRLLFFATRQGGKRSKGIEIQIFQEF